MSKEGKTVWQPLKLFTLHCTESDHLENSYPLRHVCGPSVGTNTEKLSPKSHSLVSAFLLNEIFKIQKKSFGKSSIAYSIITTSDISYQF